MASLGLHLLTVCLGVVLIFLGHVKLTDHFFPVYHSQARTEFGKLNTVFPLYKQTGWRPYAKNYRVAIGIIETSCGSLMLLAGGVSQTLASIGALGVMLNFVISFVILDYSQEYIAAVGFISLLLILRLYLGFTSKAPHRSKSNVNKKTT